MAAIVPTYSDFTTVFPQFVGAAFSTLGPVYLAMSIKLLDPSVWDDQYNFGVMLDCAHNLSLAQAASLGGTAGRELAAGPISSASGGGISTSFNTPSSQGKSATDDWYQKTIYGQQFLRLRHTVCSLGVMAA